MFSIDDITIQPIGNAHTVFASETHFIGYVRPMPQGYYRAWPDSSSPSIKGDFATVSDAASALLDVYSGSFALVL